MNPSHVQSLNVPAGRLSGSRLPLLWPTGLWVLGLLLTRTDVLPVFMEVFFLSALILALLWRHQWHLLLLFAMACLWGIADLSLHARDMQVPKDWLGAPVQITARVVSVQHLPAYSRLQVSEIQSRNASGLTGNALLYVYPQHDKAELQAYQLRSGDMIQARVRLHQPRNHLNPGAFDYRSWCFDRSIALLGSVSGKIHILARQTSWLESTRERIRRAIAASNPRASAGILHAILLGDRSRVDSNANDAFAATGTAHLLAISGMHVGMAAAWMFALFWWLLTRREVWMVYLPVRSLSLLAGLLAATVYAWLAGWPLPAIRSGVMLMAGVLAWMLAARTSPLNTLLAALWLMLIADPSAIASLSLWLSFLATAGILCWVEQARLPAQSGAMYKALHGLFWVSLLAMLATLPLIVAVFGRVPLYGLPGNLLMVPLYGLFVMPLSLAGELMAALGLDHLAGWLLQFAGVGIQRGLDLVRGIEALPYGRLWAISPGWMMHGFYALGTALVVWRWIKGDSKALVAASMSAVVGIYLLFVLSEKAIQTPTWLVWDVGQGAASSLLLPDDQVMVVDVPGRAGSRFNGGTQVAAGLREMGITHINVLMLSHAQSDHLGGALSLMSRMNRVGEIWLPDVPAAHNDRRVKAIVAEAGRRSITVYWLARGDHMTLGKSGQGVDLHIMWPPRGAALTNPNNASLVVAARLSNGATLLWPGDIEADAEAGLIHGKLAHVDAMLVPHHGSRTSSSPDFVAALHPSLSIVQTGSSNRYGFPDPAVVGRYKSAGSRVRNTADGALIIEWPGEAKHLHVSQWHEPQNGRRDIALQWWPGLL